MNKRSVLARLPDFERTRRIDIAMVELLFRYPLELWRDAALVFDSGWSPVALGGTWLVGLALIAVTLLRRELSAGRTVWVGLLQGIALAAVLAMLWRPALEVERLAPGENAVAWLLDDSRSMRIEDEGGQPRLQAVRDALVDGALLEDDVFATELHLTGHRAGEPAVAIDSLADWRGDSESSSVGDGLAQLLSSIEDRSLAAVVIVGDGADTSSAIGADWWRRLGAAGVPVHAVGTGAVERSSGVELIDVTLPPRAVAGAEVAARLDIAHPVAGGRSRVRIERAGELLHAEDITLPPGVPESRHVVRFPIDGAGLGELRVSIEDDADAVGVNDVQRRLIEVADTRRRVLYVEGEPRWEFKFIRRALHDDPEIEVVSLLRTSANKFYRQGVRDADELADGFPATRDALFAYDAVMIGSLAAAELSLDQQAALRDFVSQRGGSLLLLGGRAALADGGWARSAVAPALPVVLDARRDAATFRRERVEIKPARHGERTPWLSLATPVDGARSDTASGWDGMPALADRQSIGRVKPGALVLLETASDGEPVWVTQRYGLGSSHVFGTSGTWRWQMGLPSEDQRHERFWRNALAALVADRPDRLRVDVAAAVVRDGSPASITIEARSAAFEPLPRDALSAELVAPDGTRRPLELVADLSRPGRFTARADAPDAGPWRVDVTAIEPGESPGAEPIGAGARWSVEPDTAEDFDTLQQRDFLQRVASATGGQYLPLERIDELGALLRQENVAATRQARLPLWNMPILFLLLFGARALEWWSRWRWKRL